MAWLATTWIFWLGYIGTDDVFYSRYAYLLHRPPMNWWEFRIPAVLAIRASFALFGPTEIAAAVPNLLASLAILASVAWFTGWPKRLTWQTNAAVLLAAVMPSDVNYRTIPGANHVSAGLLAFGAVALLKGSRRVQWFGGALLALAFITHELSFFYVAILCFVALATDRRRYLQPVVVCVALSAVAFAIESLTYHALFGDFLARYKVSGGSTTDLKAGYDPDLGIGGLDFYLWPLKLLLFSKHFGFDLLLLFAGGAVAWRRFTQEQRILFSTTVLIWAWLGYGTIVPWTYRPLYRQMHFYPCLVFGVAALLPTVISSLCGNRRRIALGVTAVAITIHIGALSLGGRWGQEVDVARGLLRYAAEHPDRVFVTDVRTMNHMYAVGGFRLPDNVVCLNGPRVDGDLRVNKEPPGVPRFRFPERRIDFILINNETMQNGAAENEFRDFVRRHGGESATIVPVEYRMLVRPAAGLFEPPPSFIKSSGGAVAQVVNEPTVSVVPTTYSNGK